MSIIETIQKNRPKISKSSLKTYNSVITNLAKGLDIKIETPADVKTHLNKIIDSLKEAPLGRRKTTMASLIVFLDDGKDDKEGVLDRLRGMMYKDISKYNKELQNQEMDTKTKDNWMSYDDVMKVYNKVEKSTNDLWKQDKLSKKEFLQLQDYVLLSVLLLIPPMRSSDISYLKFKNVDKKEDNYKDKDNLIINKYKTAKTYGTRTIKVPVKLNRILNAWNKKNENEWMFVDTSLEKQLSPTKLMNRLYNIFDKKISTSMLRKIFITDKLMKDVPALTKLEEAAKDMGHSVMTAMESYKKKK